VIKNHPADGVKMTDLCAWLEIERGQNSSNCLEGNIAAAVCLHPTNLIVPDMPKSWRTPSTLLLLLFKDFTQWSATANRGIWESLK
jgi:hypothetical protein